MDLKNCEKCGRAFVHPTSKLCSRCNSISEEEEFKKVKLYLYDNPGATIVEVSEATGVSEKMILKFLREERIEIREEDNMVLDCERCGKPIRSGKFCESCAAELKKEFSKVLEPPKKEEREIKRTTKSNKMYVVEMRKKR